MTPRLLRTVALLLTWPLWTLAVGCAGLEVPEPPVENIAGQRKQRAEEADRMFGQKRDFAEFQAASARFSQGDPQGCRETLLRLLQRNGEHRDARLLLADLYLAENRPQKALEEVQLALESHPNDARVQHTLGLLLDATGQSADALVHYEQAAKAQPDNEVYAVGYYAALEAAQRAADPSRPDGLQEAGAIAGVRLKSATGWLAAERSEAPDSSTFWGTAALCPSHPSETTSHPSKTTRIQTKPSSFSSAAGYTGFAEITDAADSTPEEVSLQRAHQALAEGSWELALAHFREATATCQNNLQILIPAAVAALRHDQPGLALELLSTAENHICEAPTVHRIRGAAFYRLGDYRSSQVALQQALSLDNSSALTYFLLACTLAKLGHSESAEAHLQQARAIDPRYAVRP